MGLVYSGCECLIEKHRARHDVWNAPLAGCAAGGIMAAPGEALARGGEGEVFGCVLALKPPFFFPPRLSSVSGCVGQLPLSPYQVCFQD